jgi:hypothetical protein
MAIDINTGHRSVTTGRSWNWRSAAAALALSAALTGAALGTAVTGHAAPNDGRGPGKWNQGRYDECMAGGLGKRYCCEEAGGNWTGKFERPRYTCVKGAGSSAGRIPQDGPAVLDPEVLDPVQTSTPAPVVAPA